MGLTLYIITLLLVMIWYTCQFVHQLLRSFELKNKAPDYYYKTQRGLGYVSTQSRQISSLKNGSIMTIRQGHRCESQMLASVPSLKIFL